MLPISPAETFILHGVRNFKKFKPSRPDQAQTMTFEILKELRCLKVKKTRRKCPQKGSENIKNHIKNLPLNLRFISSNQLL